MRREGALQGPSGCSRGFSDSSENSLSLLPLLLNLSQDASVLLSNSIEGKQLWFARGFTATRTGLVGGALSSHVASPSSAGVGCLMAGVLAFNQPYMSGLGVVPETQCSLHQDRVSATILTVRGTITGSAVPRNQRPSSANLSLTSIFCLCLINKETFLTSLMFGFEEENGLLELGGERFMCCCKKTLVFTLSLWKEVLGEWGLGFFCLYDNFCLQGFFS